MRNDMMPDGNEMSTDAYEPYDFANRRHIGPSPEEIAEMLRALSGVLPVFHGLIHRA